MERVGDVEVRLDMSQGRPDATTGLQADIRQAGEVVESGRHIPSLELGDALQRPGSLEDHRGGDKVVLSRDQVAGSGRLIGIIGAQDADDVVGLNRDDARARPPTRVQIQRRAKSISRASKGSTRHLASPEWLPTSVQVSPEW